MSIFLVFPGNCCGSRKTYCLPYGYSVFSYQTKNTGRMTGTLKFGYRSGQD